MSPKTTAQPTKRYFVVVDVPDNMGSAVDFARMIRTHPISAIGTTYEFMEDMLRDFALQLGPWDPDPTKNVEEEPYVHPWTA